MIAEQIDTHAPSVLADAEKAATGRRREAQAEESEHRAERHAHVARCGFEIIGVTMRPLADAAKVEAFGAEKESDDDRMMSSLVSALDPGQKVTFIYEGGGRTPLRWHIVGEATSNSSAKEANEGVRNVRYALMAVLESRKTFFRFRPISEGTAGRVGTAQSKWVGFIQPQGTHVRYGNGPIGFMKSTDRAEENDISVCLPHYVHERARAFSSIVKLLMSSNASMRVSVALEACRLNRDQEHALKAIREVILDRSLDSDLPSHLENTANVWLKILAGCRITCSASSSQPISDSFLKMLGAEVYNGPVDICCRRADDARAHNDTLVGVLPGHVVDLRNCIPSTTPLPPLFPQPEALARHGMRQFFNRERLSLPKVGVLMGCIRDGSAEQMVRLCGKERSRHTYILGATGTGKSTLLYNLVMQDIQRGEGVLLIDPHGDLYHNVLHSIPQHRANDVVLLDPSDRERAVGINVLDCAGPCREMQVNFVVNECFAMLEKLYDMRRVSGPIFEQYYRGALLLALADPGVTSTLVDMPAVFEFRKYRAAMIKKCGSSLLTDFWAMAEEATGDVKIANLAPYVVSKLNLFVHNAQIRPIIGQAKSTVDFRAIMDNRHILLVNLSRGVLGELDMRLLGMIVLTKLMCAAMSRMNVATNRRKPFMVYVDEFQHFTTDATASLLSESRKYGLVLTCAHQNLAQLTSGKGHENLVHSVLGNVGSMVLFRLGAPDATKLAIYTRPNFGPAELQSLPNFHAAARLLTPTGPTAPFVFQTYPATRERHDPAVLRRILKARRLYSTSIEAVEEDIRKRRETIRAMT